jgi:site-specific DNA-methyltransferase (adenine-specific)
LELLYTAFEPTNYLIVWDKVVPDETGFYSQIELAGTNIKIPARIFRHSWDGARKGSETGTDKIHPHQKPVSLYKWLLSKYAKEGNMILDTHMGSQSSRIAAYDYGFDFWGFELDEKYFQDGNDRFQRHMNQLTLF